MRTAQASKAHQYGGMEQVTSVRGNLLAGLQEVSRVLGYIHTDMYTRKSVVMLIVIVVRGGE